MPVRMTRLLTAALIGAALSTAVMAATQSLTWRGDVVTANGVVKGMAKAWQSSGHGNLEIQPFNTASGLDAVASGAADIAGSARGSSGSAIDSNLTFTPVAWDGLVLVTSPSNPVSNLTLQQVHDIYYGRITNWKDVGGNEAPMDVFAVASPGDGVEYSLRKLVFGRGSQPVAAPRLYVNTTQLEQSIMLDPRGFGVTTLSSVAGNPKIKMLRIDGVAPSASSVASGAYPLFFELYLVTNPSSPNAAAAKSFVDFVQSPKGDAVLRAHDLTPYQGSPLIAMDASRRSRLLAEVGAHASAEPTYASAPAAARPALPAAAAARAAVAAAPSKPALSGVSGSVVAAPEISSIKGVRGDAFTEAGAGSRGSDFAKVTSDSYVSYGKVIKSTAKSKAGKTVDGTVNRAESKKVASAGKASASTYRVGAGETLYSIARKHGVDVAQIRNWNHLKDNTVRTGQVLRIAAR
jgi:phosphate transport system substrate-binding protein